MRTMNDNYYIVDDSSNLIEFVKVGERPGSLVELNLKNDTAEQKKLYVFPKSVLSTTIKEAYESALIQLQEDFQRALSNFQRVQNQKDKALFRVADMQEKIQALK